MSEAWTALLEALYETSVLVYPVLVGGTAVPCRANIVMPNDAQAVARSVCGMMTVPPGDPTNPLVHVASRANVRVKVGDVVLCRRVDGEVTPPALHRHCTNNATRPCSNDCGAAVHHLAWIPTLHFYAPAAALTPRWIRCCSRARGPHSLRSERVVP